MAGSEYVPKFLGGCEVTYTAAAAVTAGQLVEVTGAYQVSPASAAAQAQFGVAAQSAGVNATTAVYFEGIHTLAASGAITAGQAVTAATGGAVAAATSSTPAGEIVGYAQAAAANNLVDVRLSY